MAENRWKIMNTAPSDHSMSNDHAKSWWFDYGIAVAAVVAATLVRFAMDSALGNHYPFITYFGAIAVIAWYGRTGPAVFTLVCSAFLAFLLFIPSRFSRPLGDPVVVVGLVLFLAIGMVILAMGHGMRTARRRAERLLEEAVIRTEELRQTATLEAEQRERLRTTLASIGDAVITTDSAGCVTNLNPVAENLTGWNNADALGVPLTRVFHIVNEKTRQPVENPALRAIKEGVIVGLANHTILIGKDGTERPIDDSAAPIRCKEGEIVGGVLVFRDITERHRAQEEIIRLADETERQKRLYETVLTNTPDFVYVFGLDHKVVYANDALIKMWGRGYEGAIGKTFLEIGYEPWHAEMHDREIDQVRATRLPIYGEVPFTGTLGRRLYEYIFVPVIGADGEVEAVAGTTRDVTDRRQADEKLRESEERNKFLVTLADALRPLADPTHVQAEASRVLGEWLGANRVAYFEVRGEEYVVEHDYTDGAASVVGRHSIASFGPGQLALFQAGCTTTEGDVDRLSNLTAVEKVAFTTLMIRSYVAVPLVKNETFVGGLAVHAATPRTWTATEIAIIEETAERTWATVERVRVEAALRQSEERSVFVRRSSGVGFWYCDLPFDVLQWDELVKDHFHLAADAPVTIQTFYERLHPDDREPTRLAIERSIADRTSYNVDYRTVDPETGTVKWIRAIGRTFYADDGTPTRFDGVTFDVSQQKWAEEQQAFLIQLSDALRPLSDPIDVQAVASRVLGDYLNANRVVYFEIRGDEYVVERDYTAGVGPLVGRYPVAAFGSNLLAKLQDGHTVIEADATTEPEHSPDEQAAFAAIQVRGHVDVPLAKDGRFVAGMTVQVSDRRDWTRQDVALIENTAERTWATVERVRAEAALRASEKGRRLALDAAELGAFNIDPKTQTLIADERFRIIFAGTAAPLDYQQAFATIHPDDRERIREAVDAATRPESPAPYAEEYRVVHPDGSVRWVFAKGRINFSREGSGGHVSFDGTVADITDRKRAEEERERLLGQLRDADRRKDEFIATLAHELRNPLAPMRNSLQVMRLAGVNGTIEQARAMMERQLTQLVRLVDDLLDMSRVTSGKLELRRERVELRTVIDAAVETSRPAIELAGHELSVCMPDEPIHVDGDATRLAQVVSNLLNNSAKYTHHGGHIRLAVSHEEDIASIAIADDGIGIPPDMLGKVFEMFTQVDRSLEKTTGGLGIGLSLVKGLVEMHGGTIAAHSEGEGHGSEFIVQLPVASSAAQEVMPKDADLHPASSSRRRILVADDNIDAAHSLAKLLELLGNEVSVANDGAQAVEVAEKFRPNVILLDIGMPKLNGYEAARRIRTCEWGQEVTLVALTGWGQEDDRKKSSDAGFDQHLVKPVEIADLMKFLAK